MAQRAAMRTKPPMAPPARAGRDTAVAVLVSVLASVIALAGLVVLMAHTDHGSHAGHATAVYTAGGMSVTVNRWQWMSHDMFGGPTPAQHNFPMPAQIMPGMQTDDVNRLHVELTVSNGTGQRAPASGRDFAVETPDGRRVEMNDSSDASGGPLQLGAGTSTTMDLYFDVPLKDTVRDLVFAYVGSSVRIPFGGGAPQHQHAY